MFEVFHREHSWQFSPIHKPLLEEVIPVDLKYYSLHGEMTTHL